MENREQVNRKLKTLEERIGHVFHDRSLLEHAMTHSSLANELHKGHLGSNERLEFLGDAVLELVSSDFFYHKFPEMPEGRLTKLRASFVCEPALAYCAEQIPLGEFLLLGKGEEQTGGRFRPSVVSDALEALIGAIYLDSSLQEAREFIHRFILNDIEGKQYFYDAKTILQEEIQKQEGAELGYELISEDGPDHRKRFNSAVLLNGKELARGAGGSKKQAEQQAAFEALKSLGLVETDNQQEKDNGGIPDVSEKH
ncbi:MAG: ribonuclease III [Stomatobaculum sp.]|nr:ribonuclease III [Stomatobaculum sp.]